MAPNITSILEIRVNNYTIIADPHNKHFAMIDEHISEQADCYYTGTHDGDQVDTSRERTPAPDSVEPPFLHIAFSMRPKFPDRGWVFGTKNNSCDILLDRDKKNGISGNQFALRMCREPGSFIVKNLSQHGTLMKMQGDAYVRVKSQRSFHDRLEITLGTLRIDLLCVNHFDYKFICDWAMMYKEMEAEMPSLDINLSSGPSSTHKSLNYALDTELGRGSSAVTYRATDPFHGNVWVVKRYTKVEDIRQEVSILSRIQHIYIVQLHSYDPTTSPQDVVLEYINGLNLRQAHGNQQFSLHECKQFSGQALEALAYLHRRHITHRDIKLDNIMVHSRTPMWIKLIDFNIASDSACMRARAGTSPYIAPEVLSGGSYNSKVDIWSYGVLLLEVLCGLPADRDLHLHMSHCEKYLQAVPFLSLLIEPAPERRASAEISLSHSFLIVEDGDSSIDLPPIEDDELPDTAIAWEANGEEGGASQVGANDTRLQCPSSSSTVVDRGHVQTGRSPSTSTGNPKTARAKIREFRNIRRRLPGVPPSVIPLSAFNIPASSEDSRKAPPPLLGMLAGSVHAMSYDTDDRGQALGLDPHQQPQHQALNSEIVPPTEARVSGGMTRSSAAPFDMGAVQLQQTAAKIWAESPYTHLQMAHD
ncbi:hypothetical protein FDECE_14301 [Fusarium decemcellulare]|nr:hypothetical protein FDECE_14301 [Fusarium decemcellulare]